MRHFPWVLKVSLRKCKPLAKGTETEYTEESLGKAVKLYIKLARVTGFVIVIDTLC